VLARIHEALDRVPGFIVVAGHIFIGGIRGMSWQVCRVPSMNQTAHVIAITSHAARCARKKRQRR
jgi:hypothetical protein